MAKAVVNRMVIAAVQHRAVKHRAVKHSQSEADGHGCSENEDETNREVLFSE